MMYLRVHLKICEGCGNLWLRAEGGAVNYCSICTRKLGEFPKPRTRSHPGGRRKKHNGVSELEGRGGVC
jgi:hypothetical protein